MVAALSASILPIVIGSNMEVTARSARACQVGSVFVGGVVVALGLSVASRANDCATTRKRRISATVPYTASNLSLIHI